LRAWLDPEFIHQRPPGLAVGVQCLAAAAGPGQRLHQLSLESLAERIAGYQITQLRDQPVMVAQPQIRLGPVLKRLQAHLLEPGHEPIAQHLGWHIKQGGAAPQLKRKRRGRRRLLPSHGQAGRARVPARRLETQDIEFRLLNGDQVSGIACRDPRGRPGPKGLAQPPDVTAQ